MTAKAQAETDQATAGSSGASVGADQQNAGASGANFSETGHKAATDVNTEEAISTYNQLAVQRYMDRAAANQDKADALFWQHVQNAISNTDRMAKTAITHDGVNADRLLNINEDSAFAVQLAAVVSSAVREALRGAGE